MKFFIQIGEHDDGPVIECDDIDNLVAATSYLEKMVDEGFNVSIKERDELEAENTKLKEHVHELQEQLSTGSGSPVASAAIEARDQALRDVKRLSDANVRLNIQLAEALDREKKKGKRRRG